MAQATLRRRNRDRLEPRRGSRKGWCLNCTIHPFNYFLSGHVYTYVPIMLPIRVLAHLQNLFWVQIFHRLITWFDLMYLIIFLTIFTFSYPLGEDCGGVSGPGFCCCWLFPFFFCVDIYNYSGKVDFLNWHLLEMRLRDMPFGKQVYHVLLQHQRSCHFQTIIYQNRFFTC